MAAGADLNRVRALEGLPDSKYGLVPFDPANDVGRLRDFILSLPDDKRPALIILDGIDGVANTVKRNSHNGTDAKHRLPPYVELARETRACVIGSTRFAKNSRKNSRGRLPRVMGSVALTVMARVVIAVQHNPQHNPGKNDLPERIFVQTKNSLAGQPPGEGFRIKPATVTIMGKETQTSVVTWTGKVEGSACQLLERRQPH